MGRLIYSMIVSLDGCVADADGRFDFAGVDEHLHRFIDQQFSSIGTHLYGRRMYETMVYWETADAEPDQPPFASDYARSWQASDKIVYSTTLAEVSSERTRIEPTFDVDTVRSLKSSSDQDVSISGPHLAGYAIRAGLVDEYALIVAPVIVGGGKRFFPEDVRVDLELVEQRRFDGGISFQRYLTARGEVDWE